eukprot:CAMPEP_0183378256 /NCGR_PEP_ID=MMETSP0164_2-20130417/124816_1 /TAXON_ID=221442 /ORGANISM="Coccolithus pelagicus ssp braarudi, Strain PLY182g" /LENGTH=128 /DNA_ID=CAMNT_0025555807 /DNA_START=78 /DNA_END=465 /DNA_ORIENTATION=-
MWPDGWRPTRRAADDAVHRMGARAERGAVPSEMRTGIQHGLLHGFARGDFRAMEPSEHLFHDDDGGLHGDRGVEGAPEGGDCLPCPQRRAHQHAQYRRGFGSFIAHQVVEGQRCEWEVALVPRGVEKG